MKGFKFPKCSEYSRESVAFMVVGGFVIGIALSWVAVFSWDQLTQKSVRSVPLSAPAASETGGETPSAPVESARTNDTVENPTSKVTYDVEWKTPTVLSKQKMEDLLFGATTDTETAAEILKNATNDLNIKVCESVSRVLRVGQIRGSELDGSDVFLFKAYEHCGPAFSPWYFVVVRDGNGKLHTNEIFYSSEGFTVSSVFLPLAGEIKTPALPEKISLAGGKMLIQSGEGFSRTSENYYERPSAYERIGTSADGLSLYREIEKPSGSGCITVFDVAGIPHEYASVIPSEAALGAGPNIAWATPPTKSVVFQPFVIGGCGTHECTDLVNATSVVDVIEAGRTDDGDPVYVPRDYTRNTYTSSTFQMWLWGTGGGKTEEEMLKGHSIPFFFWKDAFGRWVKYVDASLLPVGECGKPVIYLYPEKMTDVRVALPKFINVTKSDPAYPSTGWTVRAEPDGTLACATGTYGSLYWEGTGVGYEAPKTGFVVKDGDVDAFLARTLLKYGLNEKESREFREFWVPKMTGASYYRISFLTDVWSKAAPLSVVPRPKTSIRIFMDWSPLSSPISIPEPRISTPKRNGFTLVEWGGTLYK